VLVSGKPVSQYASYSLIFSPLRSIINREQYKKYLFINPAITENEECSIVKACLIYRFKVGVLLDHGFVSLLAVRTCWTAFQAKNNTRSGSALTLVSHRSHKVRIANRHLCAKGERNRVQKRTKAIFGRTMMRALELLWLAKRHIPEVKRR